MGLSQSVPTPNTQEFARVVINVAVGAPEGALADFVAPIAPEPFDPETSTPSSAITVRDDAAFCDKVAATVTPLN